MRISMYAEPRGRLDPYGGMLDIVYGPLVGATATCAMRVLHAAHLVHAQRLRPGDPPDAWLTVEELAALLRAKPRRVENGLGRLAAHRLLKLATDPISGELHAALPDRLPFPPVDRALPPLAQDLLHCLTAGQDSDRLRRRPNPQRTPAPPASDRTLAP